MRDGHVHAAPSPRLARCLEAAKAAGASEEWLHEKYSSIRKASTHGHQAFRVLCYAGPGKQDTEALLGGSRACGCVASHVVLYSGICRCWQTAPLQAGNPTRWHVEC